MVSTVYEHPLMAEAVLHTLRAQPHLFESFQIKSLALFGSVARNQATATSDLDFLVEFDADPTLTLYMNLKFFLEDLFQRTVDLVIKTDIKPQIRETVIQAAIHVA
ncbi:MAG: nucleotidyltransferase family protein [Leptolyngbyaceae cyanobacterium bins.349]|nr:nucleotidyltransferase family protein [Leptolyngbyaceae cyanobacterium bins.349]